MAAAIAHVAQESSAHFPWRIVEHAMHLRWSIGRASGLHEDWIYVQGELHNPRNALTGRYWEDAGFHPDFRDLHNQPYHTWAYIRQTCRRGRPWPERLAWLVAARTVGEAGNIWHEVIDSYQAEWYHRRGMGNSWQDYFLGEAGREIGVLITAGVIRSPSETGDLMRRRLGPSGPGSYGLVRPLRALLPLAGYEQQ